MTRAEIEQGVFAVVKWADPLRGGIKLEAKLVDDLGFDSLDIANVELALEDEFRIDLPDAADTAPKTVADLVNTVATVMGVE